MTTKSPPPKSKSGSLKATARPTPLSDAKQPASTSLSRLVGPGDLSVVFQPILRVSNMKVFAYEALVRCKVEAYRNPMVLFEHAVQTGCTGQLGRTIRELALPLCERVPLFVNIHPVELEERWLVRTDDPIFSHDRAIYLEITEAVPMAQFDLCKSVLRETRSRADIRLVVDDLGAGYSNLKYIADLHPAVVKIDRALIAGTKPGSRHEKLIAGIVSMCKLLDATVVAEGIETDEEFQVAKNAGVQFVQGYLFAKPGFPLPMRDQVE
jgi:EAL domain-containing protein (putative c-di-GMP-specific phosphodiesterase class I)